MADPRSSAQARRELRKMLLMVADGGGVIVPKRELVSGMLGVLSPRGEPHANERRYAKDYHLGLTLRYLGLTHLPVLESVKSTELWTWARNLCRTMDSIYERNQHALRSEPGVGRFFQETPDTNYLIKGSCRKVMLILGTGIALLGHDPRVHLPVGMATPNPALAALFSKSRL